MGKVKKSLHKIMQQSSGKLLLDPTRSAPNNAAVDLAANSLITRNNNKLVGKSKGGRVNKRKKREGRHNGLLEKMVVAQRQKVEAIAKQKRDNTYITGDMQPLLDALPSLDELLQLTKNKDALRTGIPSVDGKMGNKSQQKNKARPQKIIELQKDNNKRISYFKKIVLNRQFLQNPREAIAAHLANRRNVQCSLE